MKKYGIVVNIASFINMNEFGHIYLIINKFNNKKYVGQSIGRVKSRLNEHIRNINEKYPLYKAFRKYGLNGFEFSIIDFANNIDELNEKEINYINMYKSNQKKLGYNLESGGRNGKPCQETLIKMSNAHSGIKQSQEWINNRITKANTVDAKKYGRKKTEEEKQYLSKNSSKYWQGKSRDEETKKKISQTKKANGLSSKQKELICKKVYKVDMTSYKIYEYESTKQASIIENVNQSTISRWCLKHKVNNNYLWRY